jgi:hypothetical protein
MAGASGSGASTASLQPQPETVDALLAAAVRVVEDERLRGGMADTKAGQLVGFTGVILAIDASLGRDVFDHGISGAYSDVFVAFFVVSLLALVVAVYVAIRGLLRPQETLAFRRADVQRLADDDLVLAESVEIKRVLIRTYGEELISEEQRNNRKLDVVNRAGLLLLVGVFALAAEGGTLAVEHLAMSTSKQQASQPIMPKSNLPVSDPVVARPKPPDRLTLGPIKKGGSGPPVVRK